MSIPLEAGGTPKRKRRVRYKGKNPRRFDEKYKELNSEKYADDIKKWGRFYLRLLKNSPLFFIFSRRKSVIYGIL